MPIIWLPIKKLYFDFFCTMYDKASRPKISERIDVPKYIEARRRLVTSIIFLYLVSLPRLPVLVKQEDHGDHKAVVEAGGYRQIEIAVVTVDYPVLMPDTELGADIQLVHLQLHQSSEHRLP